jgi:hypothetical protein
LNCSDGGLSDIGLPGNQGVTMNTVDTFEKLANSHLELSAQLSALTAVVGAIAATLDVDFDGLEDCVTAAARRLRPGQRPRLFRNSSKLLQELEVMQMVLKSGRRKARKPKKRSKVQAV